MCMPCAWQTKNSLPNASMLCTYTQCYCNAFPLQTMATVIETPPWLQQRHVYAGVSSHLGLCCSTVLICAAHVDAVVASAAAVAGVYIRTQHTANDVAQMGHIVDIRQGACDQNVSRSCSKDQTKSTHKWDISLQCCSSGAHCWYIASCWCLECSWLLQTIQPK